MPISFIFIALWVAVIYQSPKKLRTLGRMLLAFLLTILLIIVPAAFVRRGNPQMMGMMAALVGFSVAALVGWWHGRSLKVMTNQPPSLPKASDQKTHD